MLLLLLLIVRPTFLKIWKRKAVEDFSPIPYLATLLNCGLWVFYGMPFVHPNSILIVTINGVGVVLESLYIIMFFVYGTKKLRVCGIETLEIFIGFGFRVWSHGFFGFWFLVL